MEKLAETYKIRKERVLAIVALRKARASFLEQCRTINGDQVCFGRKKKSALAMITLLLGLISKTTFPRAWALY